MSILWAKYFTPDTWSDVVPTLEQKRPYLWDFVSHIFFVILPSFMELNAL